MWLPEYREPFALAYSYPGGTVSDIIRAHKGRCDRTISWSGRRRNVRTAPSSFVANCVRRRTAYLSKAGAKSSPEQSGSLDPHVSGESYECSLFLSMEKYDVESFNLFT